MNEKPKRKESAMTPIIKVILIVAVATVIGCGVCFAGFFGILNTLLAPVTEVGDAFMTSLKDEDYYEAFNQLSYNLKSQSENPQRLESLVLEYDASPDGWNFNSRSVRNEFGDLSGTVRFKNGERADIVVRLQMEDGIWRITYFEFGRLSSEEL